MTVARAARPSVTVGTANRLVLQHATHLGITADEADELLERGR